MGTQPQHHFHWDNAKALSNKRKHGISFEEAAAVFDDPLALTRYDFHNSETEERWYTVGQLEGLVLLAVFHTLREREDGVTSIRIVSARKATQWERRKYESGDYGVQEPVATLEGGILNDDDEMPAEIDFSNAVRGKFYRKNAIFHFPVYLDPELLVFFKARATEQGTDLAPLLNGILRREMAQSQVGK